jgi:hypothetical protein
MRQNYVKNTKKPKESGESFSFLLDTSAQLRTNPSKNGLNSLKKRAFAKHQTNEVIFPLIDLDSTLNKAYWRTFHCTNVLLQSGKTITGKYCNNRWCIVCNRIRTAKLIEGYLPVIKEQLRKPMFVTLTVPNVPAEDLRKTIGSLIGTVRTITDLFRKRRNFRLRGLRKVECTYNARGNDYHPHLHLLVDGYQASQELVNAWLNHYPDADKRGQDIRPADDNSLIELFKYSTKLTTGDEKKKKKIVAPEALDIIFKALRGKRVFQPIGLKKIAVTEDIDELQAQTIEDLKTAVDVWIWEHELKDWLNSSGEFLTEYNDNRLKKDLNPKKTSYFLETCAKRSKPLTTGGQ